MFIFRTLCVCHKAWIGYFLFGGLNVHSVFYTIWIFNNVSIILHACTVLMTHFWMHRFGITPISSPTKHTERSRGSHMSSSLALDWVLFVERKSTPKGTRSSLEGTRSSQALDWVLFLVDFSGGCGHLFSETGVKVGEEWIKKIKKEEAKPRPLNAFSWVTKFGPNNN